MSRLAVGDRAQPVRGLDHVGCGLEVAAQLVEAGRQSSPMPAPAENTLDLIAVAECGAVVVRWLSTETAAPLPVGDLVVGLRDDRGAAPRENDRLPGHLRIAHRFTARLVPEARPAPAALAGWPPTPRPSCPTDTGAPDRDDRPRCRTRARGNHTTVQAS